MTFSIVKCMYMCVRVCVPKAFYDYEIKYLKFCAIYRNKRLTQYSITHALSALWNFTVEPKSLDMLFFTVVFEVLFVAGFPLGAEWYNRQGDKSHTIPHIPEMEYHRTRKLGGGMKSK